ncbi:MAG: arginine repressor [Clostridia bacterium]|nr:arginine repressor [Clostridia bacterium]
MARSARQSKILEIISTYEVDTQEELVLKLKELNFDVTQATVSRDIKELGLIKILSNETGKYKYAFADTNSQASNKYIFLLKESVISLKTVKNFVVIRTLKGMASSICSVIDKFNLDDVMGCVNGDDTIMIIFSNNEESEYALNRLENIINS